MTKKPEKLNFNLNFLGDFDETENLPNDELTATNKELQSKDMHSNQLDTKKEHINQSSIDGDKTGNENDKIKKDNKNNLDICTIIYFAFIALLALFLVGGIISIKVNEKKQIEIEQITTQAYNYKKQNNYLYYDLIKKLAKLSKKDFEVIDQEMKQKFDNEKKELLSTIANEMVESKNTDDSKINELIKIYFYGDKVQFEKELGEFIQAKKTEVVRELINDWRSDSSVFVINKNKYLNTIFDNDIDKLNHALDQELGYKHFALKEHELPKSGIMQVYTNEQLEAPFEILTQRQYVYQEYGDNDNYYIKLINAYTDETVLTIFIRSGESARFDVPLGSYKIKYASGKTWYGEEDLFGHNTSYASSDQILSFRISGQYVKGHTLTLHKVANGNFASKEIKAEEF